MSLNLFINLKNGIASIDTARLVDAQVTDVSDILAQFGDDESEKLTASLDIWIDEQVQALLSDLDKIELNSATELKEYLLGEADFLDITMSQLELDHTEDPEIRAYQLSSFDDYSYKRFDQACY